MTLSNAALKPQKIHAHACFVFLSTDQVYDGLAAPYTETSAAAPVNVYGQSKLSLERALTAALPSRSVCLRSSRLSLCGRYCPFFYFASNLLDYLLSPTRVPPTEQNPYLLFHQ